MMSLPGRSFAPLRSEAPGLEAIAQKAEEGLRRFPGIAREYFPRCRSGSACAVPYIFEAAPNARRTGHFARSRPSPLPTGRMSNGRLWHQAAVARSSASGSRADHPPRRQTLARPLRIAFLLHSVGSPRRLRHRAQLPRRTRAHRCLFRLDDRLRFLTVRESSTAPAQKQSAPKEARFGISCGSRCGPDAWTATLPWTRR